MSEGNLKPKAPESADLSEQQVSAYLRENPGFFLDQGELLSELTLPHRAGTAVSLVERQMELLRQRLHDSQQELNELVGIARENEQLFEKTRRLTLALLDARSLDDLAIAIQEGFRDDFGTDACSLLLIGDMQLDTAGQARAVPLDELEDHVPRLLKLSEPASGVFPEAETEFLFRLHDQPIQSAVVAPLHHPDRDRDLLGVLALGSYERARFHDRLATSFLNYVREILARCLARISDSP